MEKRMQESIERYNEELISCKTPMIRRKVWRMHFLVVCLINAAFMFFHYWQYLMDTKDIIKCIVFAVLVSVVCTLLLSFVVNILGYLVSGEKIWGGFGMVPTGGKGKLDLEDIVLHDAEGLIKRNDVDKIDAASYRLWRWNYYTLVSKIRELWVTTLASALIVSLGYFDSMFLH